MSDPDARRFKLLRMYSEASAVAAVGVACLVPFGWTFHVASLLSVLAGLVTMKAYMATGVAFCGISVRSAAPRRVSHFVTEAGL